MLRKRFSLVVRLIVAARANHRCEYCQCRSDHATESFEVEHIVPLFLGGSSTLDNLAFCCRGRNSMKWRWVQAKDPLTGATVALFHPRNDKWVEHFAWKDGGLLMEGLTPAGRATIATLRTNRDGVVNLRRRMVEAKLHPPADMP